MGGKSGVVAAPPDGDSVVHGDRAESGAEQDSLRLCLGCLLLVGLPLVGLVLYGYFFVLGAGFCSESVYQDIASPSGTHVAQVVVIGCGGATVGPDTEVRLRSPGAEPDSKGEIVIEFDDGPVEKKLSVSWASEKRLLIEYDCIDAGGVYGKRYRWRAVGISYRCVDH